MYMAQPGHIDHIKQINAGRVYKLIDQKGPISRIDLSKESELAPASITKITRELIDAHLIHETTVQEAISRGRPAVGLQTNNIGWQFLSMRLGRGYLTIALHELGGEVLIDTKIDIHEIDQDDVLARLLFEIEEFFQTYAAQLDRVTSIAITLPGLVNSEQGIVLQMPHYNVKNLALGPEIYKATGLPVFVANDTRAWALAEKLFGHSQDVDNSVLISIHHGLGAGIVLDGRVLQGRHGNIGELGHIQIDPNGKRCHCGNYGCLETVASSQAIRDQVKSRILAGEPSCLEAIEDISIEDICAAAADGDPLAVDVIQQLGRYLGAAIAIVINLFNPDKVLIGGVINQAKAILYPSIEQCIREQSLPVYHQDLQLVESRFYKQATMPGAALIKQALYDGLLLMKVVEG
ncbi:sugar metabolism global transcriptional regulator Mlc [Vibrio mimicus]|uniref:ROK family protein n=1 Tax=Vibrio mimicus TaxID=674 RepID=A0A2J9UXI7_VIBMI|nr:ROK family protein [Vibrio mimicus]ERM55531.1 transcriptional regulator [Vibrio mimicus CAIM 1883]ERM55747.1 transcriptional regulator [Vibrio mimicus CAIM 1882]AMG04989.1 ROK family protein [Vibrio mimicus]EEW11331.1 DNA-binding transcriptional repressor DgsA [Vibrio mimicus VM573]EEY38066.1 Mlc transcriptional repressor of MalT (the transcriptional activator of maltose regulon) and manXYZ operon [Vibrio mimicus MB451]